MQEDVERNRAAGAIVGARLRNRPRRLAIPPRAMARASDDDDDDDIVDDDDRGRRVTSSSRDAHAWHRAEVFFARFARARCGPLAFVACAVAGAFVLACAIAALTTTTTVKVRTKTPRANVAIARARARDATTRWAALDVPTQCLSEKVSPTAVIPGLELHEIDGERAFYLTKTASTTTMIKTEDELEEVKEVREELEEAKSEMREAEKDLEAQIASEEEELKILEDTEGKNMPQVQGRRLMATDEDEAPTTTLGTADGGVRRFRFVNPLLIDGMDMLKEWRRTATTEEKMLYHIANITGYDARCQFKTMQCADMAEDLLARALKADAAAVVNENSTPDELKQLSQVLIKYTRDPRTKYDAAKLPSLGGAPKSMGTCAWTTEAEYNPQSGERYDRLVSRFATAIDNHDTAVYCSMNTTNRFCKFTRLTSDAPLEEVTVELDEQSYENARAVGRLIHDSLSADVELGSNVVGWGYRGDPSPAFISLLMLIRSNRCTRVDVYGQPGVPINWYNSAQGYAHMVAVPGSSPADRELARVLLQEKFFYRTLMHYRKMCFFK